MTDDVERERKAIVEWLRGILVRPELHEITGEYRRGHDDAIASAAHCIEAGDHLKDTNQLSGEN